MRRAALLLLLLLSCAIQLFWSSLLGGATGCVPHLAFIATAYAALTVSPKDSLFVAVVAGLLLDALSLDPWSANVLSLALAAGLLELGARGGWGERPLPRALLVAAALLVSFGARSGLVWLIEGSAPPWRNELLAAGYTLALSGPSFAVLDRLVSFFLPRREWRW